MPFMDTPRGLILSLLVAMTAAGCSRPPAENLLLVSFDTTRADRLSAYGYPLPTSPNVDALARRGSLFTNAFTHAPSTLPSHCSLLTGLLPPGHGVRANGRFHLAEEHLTLAEILRERGFATAAVVGALPLDERFGLGQGFDLYDGDFQGGDQARGVWLGHSFAVFQRDAREVTERALAWLAERDGPWFLFVHYFDPHAPYDAPAPFSERFADPYDAEIAYADHHLGRLLDTVAGRGEGTLVALTADHGEGLGEHGEDAHNRYLYNSTIRVPLVVALDGEVRAGARIESAASHVDVVPTVLELLGVEDVPALAGRSLAAALRGAEEGEPPRPVYSETLEWTLGIDRGIEVRSLVHGRYKLVRSDVEKDGESFTVFELYDLAADPGELKNLARRDVELRDRMARALEGWSRELEASAFRAESYELDEETLEGLRSLGYLE